ncbi:hypothetical protein M501DRAFT_990642 [Patellaria atrata CBS 101060]|uniref:Uncharacterized protein n=1 Tax=Patellaria atrata CBS 101060 TaxID=1346257 RepID=A0A9P4VSQ2_9PEZI|nr:hypothetical protein M501DRAFT_990642 [Patellaria atrata CBS 101060]
MHTFLFFMLILAKLFLLILFLVRLFSLALFFKYPFERFLVSLSYSPAPILDFGESERVKYDVTSIEHAVYTIRMNIGPSKWVRNIAVWDLILTVTLPNIPRPQGFDPPPTGFVQGVGRGM